MYAPEDTGGDDVIQYELYRNEGTLNSAFQKVQTYADAGGDNASLLTHSLTVADDSLIVGRHYTFKFRSRNTVGWSVFTDFTRVGLGE
jgi:hypothetical protein